MLFSHSLGNRGYYGKVIFDHNLQKLELKVQTTEQAATQGMSKDPKSLSGGEKSFSTICLLLALWEAVGCPIRCLGTSEQQCGLLDCLIYSVFYASR